MFNNYVMDIGSLSEKVNPYEACSYGLCREFLCGAEYALCTSFYSFVIACCNNR